MIIRNDIEFLEIFHGTTKYNSNTTARKQFQLGDHVLKFV